MPQSSAWDFEAGVKMSLEEIMDVVREEEFNVTLTGGDPLYNPGGAGALVKAIRAEGLTVWIYTGFTWEEIVEDKSLIAAVEGAEAIVEGRFMESLRDESLPFRGSSNQRIVYLA